MKRILLLSVIGLAFLSGCMLLQPLPTMSPPAWIQGTWSTGIIDADYTFTTTTMIQRSSIITLDMAALFREMNIFPDETITATLYSFTVPDAGEGAYTMEFAKINANTIHMTMRFAYATLGPVPLYRQ